MHSLLKLHGLSGLTFVCGLLVLPLLGPHGQRWRKHEAREGAGLTCWILSDERAVGQRKQISCERNASRTHIQETTVLSAWGRSELGSVV